MYLEHVTRLQVTETLTSMALVCDDVFCIIPSLYILFSVLDAEFRANLVDEVTISCEKSIVNVIWGGRR